MHTILIATAEHLTSECLHLLLARDPEFEVVGHVDNIRDLFEQVVRERPRLVLLDEKLPRLNGMPTPLKLRNGDNRLKVVALTHDRAPIEINYLQGQGYSGVVSMHASFLGLCNVLHEVMDSSRSFPTLNPPLFYPLDQGKALLTIREIDIVRKVAAGMKSAEISTRLGISLNTVNTHRRNIARKLDACNSAQVLRKAHELSLL